MGPTGSCIAYAKTRLKYCRSCTGASKSATFREVGVATHRLTIAEADKALLLMLAALATMKQSLQLLARR